MSADEDVLYGLYDDDISIIKEWTKATAVTHTFFGIHATLYFIAAYLLINQGIRNNKSRLFLFICSTIMFLTSIAYMCVYNEYVQLNWELLLITPPDIEIKQRNLQIVTNCLLRLNFMLSDAIVVWRAWALFKDEARVQWGLISCLAVSYVGTTVDIVLLVLVYMLVLEDVPEYSLIMTIPLLLTNVIATAAIGYKTWGYKKMVGDLLRQAKRMTATELTMLLLVESGAIYCIIWALTLASALGVMPETVTSLLLEVLCIIAGLYPTLVVIIVALQKSVIDSVANSSDILPSSAPASLPSKSVPAYIPYQQTMQISTNGANSFTGANAYADNKLEKAESTSSTGRRSPQDFSFA
ncbi:hypothetical protein FB107DRAFT_270920 [Schizophyllum commune]